jgi:SAM-dependent methyltransferase
MYDKHLLGAEIRLITSRIPVGSRVLDAGCGEAEGTAMYAALRDVRIDAADFSEVRLSKARERVGSLRNVTLHHVDFLEAYDLPIGYDSIISQRFLINLPDWDAQRRVLRDFAALLGPNGRLLMLEGSRRGAAELDELRSLLGLDPIPIKWHNVFFDDLRLVQFMRSLGLHLIEEVGMGTYFALTRAFRPYFDQGLDWDSDFNLRAASPQLAELFSLGTRFSRLKLWVFGR